MKSFIKRNNLFLKPTLSSPLFPLIPLLQPNLISLNLVTSLHMYLAVLNLTVLFLYLTIPTVKIGVEDWYEWFQAFIKLLITQNKTNEEKSVIENLSRLQL